MTTKGNTVKKDTKLTYAEIIAMTVAERYALMADGVKLGKKVVETRDNFRAVTPQYAKVVAALKRDHRRMLDEKLIAADTTFKDYFAQNCGGALPGRLETLASFFNSMCLVDDPNGKPLLAEECYDDASVNSLEIANKCINAAKEKAQAAKTDWRGDNDTLDVINALSKPGDATKKLKEIRKRQSPEKSETAADENAAVLTPEHAIEFLIAWIAGAADKAEEKTAAVFSGTLSIADAWGKSGIDNATLNRWSDNISKGVAPHMTVISEETLAAAAAN